MNTTATTANVNAAPQLDPLNVATAALWRHAPHYPTMSQRAKLIESAIDELVINHDMSERAAENAAMQAYAEIESINAMSTIDITASGQHGMVVVRNDGSRVLITLRDLDELLNSRQTVVANRDTRRLRVLSHRH